MDSHKLLLIGWDAADWRMIRPLIDQGKMPNLAAMMETGIAGNLATLRPALSPMLWTSIATGKYAWKHGILGFVEPDPHTGRPRPISNLNRKTKAVWNILSQEGFRTNVIGWWPSHPVERINGVMVSNRFQHAPAPPGAPWPVLPESVHPERLIEPLEPLRLHPGEVDGETLLPFVPRAPDVDQEKDRRLFNLAKIIAENATVHAVATGALQVEPWDFMAVYYDGIDHFGHGFMKYHPPRRTGISERDFGLYRHVMEGAYRYHDMMLGVLLQLAGDEATVILMSDHGFHPDHLRPAGLPNEPAGPAAEHRQYGIFVMKGPGIARGTRLTGASLLDVTPTILHCMGLPVGEDMDGRVLQDVFETPAEAERIASWDAVDGEHGMHPADRRMEPGDATAAIHQLVDLGYIDEPDQNHGRAMEELDRELKYNLARAYYGAQRFADAVPIFEELWETWNDESRFGLYVLLCRIALKDAAGARRVHTDLVASRTRSAERAREELKSLRADREDEEEGAKEVPRGARRKIRRLRGRATIDPAAHAFYEAQVCFLEENFAKALELFESLEEKASPGRRLNLLVRIGETHLALGDAEAAHARFREALAIDDECGPAHLGVARSRLVQGRMMEAAGAARQAAELDAANPRAHYVYGQALTGAGHPKWAASAYEAALAANPHFPEAHERMAELYETDLRRPRLAARHRKRAQAVRAQQASLEGAIVHPPDSVRERYPGPSQPPVLRPAREQRGRVRCGVGEWITVVSGLPRSGTSMMMQMLEAGGLPICADEHRPADESNRRGYYEHQRVRALAKEADWLAGARGQVIKIVTPLLLHLPEHLPFKLIIMHRPLEEVLASQRSMLERQEKNPARAGPEGLGRVYAQMAQRSRAFLDRHGQADVLPVDYHEVLRDPAAAAARIAEFLAVPDLHAGRMAAAVAPDLRRERVD